MDNTIAYLRSFSIVSLIEAYTGALLPGYLSTDVVEAVIEHAWQQGYQEGVKEMDLESDWEEDFEELDLENEED